MGPRYLVRCQLFEVQDLFYRSAFSQDLLLKKGESVDQLFRPGWATGNIDIDGNNLIDSLDKGVVIENSSRGGASAHRDDPFGFGHLIV